MSSICMNIKELFHYCSWRCLVGGVVFLPFLGLVWLLLWLFLFVCPPFFIVWVACPVSFIFSHFYLDVYFLFPLKPRQLFNGLNWWDLVFLWPVLQVLFAVFGVQLTKIEVVYLLMMRGRLLRHPCLFFLPQRLLIPFKNI